jgi:hypothetical protein
LPGNHRRIREVKFSVRERTIPASCGDGFGSALYLLLEELLETEVAREINFRVVPLHQLLVSLLFAQ